MSSKDNKKIKNVVIINDFDYTQGGASKVAIETANLLAKNYKDINVYFFSGCSNDSSTLNEKVIRVSSSQKENLKDDNRVRGMINGIYNIKAKRELKKLLTSLDKENTIIHVHGWTKCLSSSIFDICFKLDYKLVLTLHDYFTACPNGGYFNYKKNEICKIKPLSAKCAMCNCDSRNYFFKLYRLIRQFVQKKIVKLNKKLENVITISDFSENILKLTLGNNVKIHRVYNPIDFNEKLKIVNPNNNEYYLYVGRVSKEKGVDLFCEAITKLNLKGIVVGDGTEKEVLAKKFPNIEFVGWKTPDEVKKYMLHAKRLIFTSKWYECAPLTTMEALKMGLPCLVSRNCAAVDQIVEGKNGYSFEDVDELCTLLTHDNLKNFTYEFNYDYLTELIKCYEEVL